MAQRWGNLDLQSDGVIIAPLLGSRGGDCMYLDSGRKRRRSSPVRVLILLALIGAGIYTYLQIRQEKVEPPFVPTPTPTRSAASYVSEAENLYWEGNLSEAIAAYEQALELEPSNVEAYVALARLLTLERRTLEAVHRGKQAVEMAPNNAAAWAVLGLAYDWHGAIQDAIEACTHALELDPESVEGYTYLAEAYADAGRWAEATETAQTALELDDTSVEAHRSYAWVLEVQGNYWQAIEEYKRALEIHPKLAHIHIALGKNYLALGDFDAAMRSFRRAVEVDPNNAEAYFRLGRAYYENGQHDDAETYLKQATEVDPESGSAFGYLAFTYWSRRNYEDAIPNLERAIALDCFAARRKAQGFFVTVEDQGGDRAKPSSDVVMEGDFALVPEKEPDTLRATLKPTVQEETWDGAVGTVTLDTRSGKYTVVLERMPRTAHNQVYVGWFEGVNTLSGDPLSAGPLKVGTDGSVEAELEAAWVEGPRIEYFYTLGLAHFYMAECEESYPLFEAALQIDPEEQNALKGIQLCREAEAEE